MSNETHSFIQRYSLLILVIGIVILLVGVVNIGLNASFVNRAAVSEGTVLRVSYDPGMYDSAHYDTTVEFMTSEGQLVRFEQPFEETNVGDKVKVLYNPSNPSEARIYGNWQFWGWWSLITVTAVVVIFVGLWGCLSKRKSHSE